MSGAPRVILATLNAKYIHASLGLRYLLANMERHGSPALRAATVLREFTIHRPVQEVADALLQELGPPTAAVQVLGLGVYVWNVVQTTALLRLLKSQRPALKLVLGGPEVSHEWEGQEIFALADHLITGWGDVSFPRLCRALTEGPQPLMKVLAGEQPPLEQIALPYAQYDATDLAHRVLYVEASRGCPFKCEFCLSALDKTAWAFEADAFLSALEDLYQRGARTFKFVDRTFNLKVEASARLLQFFLDKLAQPAREAIFLHFEVVPDHLPDRLRELIVQFPPGVLQFEIGIQSFNPQVQARVARRQDNERSCANIAWLVQHTQAHLHTDLIFGLPGESWDSFAAGFDRLLALKPHEIQLGLLKRLRGTPLAQRSLPGSAAQWGMVYDTAPPYTVLQTDAVDAAEVQAFARLARYWDLLANSGRFSRTLALLLAGPSPFAAFADFSQWLWGHTARTSGLTPEMLVDALFDYLAAVRDTDPRAVREALLADYLGSGARASPAALRGHLPARLKIRGSAGSAASTRNPRQQRHQSP